MNPAQLEVIEQTVLGSEQQFLAVLADTSMVFEREARFAIQQIVANDYTAKIAMSNRESVITAVSNVAAIGITLNPVAKQAYLVPRKGVICLDVSYMGLLHIAVDSGSIRWGQAELVYSSDTFRLVGVDKQPLHERDPFAKERGDVVGVYVVVKTCDGDYLTTAMSTDEINNIRDRSESYKAFVEGKAKSAIWASDWGEMAKKTVIKRAYKTWPKSIRLDTAIDHLNTVGGEGFTPIENYSDKPKSAAEIAASARAVIEDSEERQKIIADLEETAKADGLAGLGTHWKTLLSAQQRKMVGAVEIERIKALAQPKPDPEVIAQMDDAND